MKVLIACEESQAECMAFRALGHEAYSCDIQECSGGHPEWHIHGDALAVLNGRCKFETQDGLEHEIRGKWDLLIAHPPCTDLAVSGARHFEKKRADGRQKASIEFFCRFLVADCDRIAVENPVGIISGNYILDHYPAIANAYGLPKKPDQIVQPYEHGDPERKATCLWLKNLPPLIPTNIVDPKIVKYTCKNGKVVTFSEMFVRRPSGISAGKWRSKSFPGIAKAMAEQWGGPAEGMEDWMQ